MHGGGFLNVLKKKAIAIEVKTGKKPLKIKDIDQVRGYADSKQQRFVILSNGYEYVLLDFGIDTEPVIDGDASKSYVVFWFDIFQARGKERTELKYFKYLKFENVCKRQSSLFYCDIAQYREWKLEQGMKQVSWNAYRCTLYQFFDFYSKKVLYKNQFEAEGKRAYETIGMDSIKEFIKERKRNSENVSRDTIKAEDIHEVIKFLKQGRNSTRNTVLFLLTVTLGLERSQLLKLTWDNFAKITNDEKWKNYSPKYLRCCLIKTLFSTGYSIEDIIYYRN